MDTGEGWVRHYYEAWKEVRRRCVGCSDLLGWLVYGWGLPSEDLLKGAASKAERKRRQYLLHRGRGRVPTVEEDGEERPLQVDDPRQVWEEAGVPDHALEDKFPDPQRGRPRLHPEVTPEVLDDILSSLQAALSHLYDVPTADLEAHFTESYGRPWPPHLEEVHQLLVDEWTRADRDLSAAERGKRKGRATARRVAMQLPIECSSKRAPATHIAYEGPDEWEGLGVPAGAPWPWAEGVYEVTSVGRETAVVDVTYRDCPFTYDQIRGLDRHHHDN